MQEKDTVNKYGFVNIRTVKTTEAVALCLVILFNIDDKQLVW